MMSRRRWLAAVVGALTVTLVAGLMRLAVPVAAQRATLPPTWTPTFTRTATATPSNTPTPTVTPTINPDTFCESELIIDAPDPGQSVPFDGQYRLIVGFRQRGLRATFAAVHRLSEQGILLDLPTPGYYVPDLAAQGLPRTGLYDWTIELSDGAGEVLCTAEGYFFVQPESLYTPPPTDDSPPSTVIVVTATPNVTATPVTPTPTPRIPVIQGSESILPLPTGITPQGFDN